jgi:hypothetical protein
MIRPSYVGYFVVGECLLGAAAGALIVHKHAIAAISRVFIYGPFLVGCVLGANFTGVCD